MMPVLNYVPKEVLKTLRSAREGLVVLLELLLPDEGVYTFRPFAQSAFAFSCHSSLMTEANPDREMGL